MQLDNALKAKITADAVAQVSARNNSGGNTNAAPQQSNIHLMDELIPAGKVMRVGQRDLQVKVNSALVFADHAPTQNWGHPCSYLFYDERGQLSQKIDAELPPLEMLHRPEIFKVIQAPVKMPANKRVDFDKTIASGGVLQLMLDQTTKRYAILFSGMSNNRHVNDIEFLYRTLVDVYHFKESNILVANHDGTVNYFDNPKPVSKWPGNNTPYRMKVWAKGDKAGLDKAIDEISKRIKSNDLLLLHVNNHGGHDGTQSNICTYPDWDGYTASDFGAKIKAMPKFSKLIVMLEQCHSGGFINPILNNSPAASTHVAAACKEADNSAGGADFDPFALDWICGVTGRSQSGGSLSVTVDANKDFNVCATEAFDYAHAVNTAGDTSVSGDKPAACGKGIYLTNGDANIMMAWKGMDNDQAIWYSYYDGGSWATQQRVPGVATSVGPSLAQLNGNTYMAWKGMDNDQKIWWTSHSAFGWAAQQQVPGVATSYRPALAAFNGTLYMAWKGMGNDQAIWWASFDGTHWSAQQQVPGVATSVGPSLAVFQGKLYMAWKGMNSDQTIWWSTFDGSHWAPQKQVPGVATSVGPSLATLNNRLYMAWKGKDNGQGIWYSNFDGSHWAAEKQVPGVATSVGPSLVSAGSRLYMSWKGMNNDQGIWYAIFNGSDWSAQTNAGAVATSVGTSMASMT